MEVWQDFGQRIDLAVRIRDILHDYPEGTSALKELIQVRLAPLCAPESPYWTSFEWNLTGLSTVTTEC